MCNLLYTFSVSKFSFVVDLTEHLQRISVLEDTQVKILDTLSDIKNVLASISSKLNTTNNCTDHTTDLSSELPSDPVKATSIQREYHTSAVISVDPLPLSHLYSNKPLPSSAIDKSQLVSVDNVLRSHKAKLNKPSTLAQLLARESFFGVSVMAQCTPGGTKDLPALPKDEMSELKKLLYSIFPQYSPDMFEKEWRQKCWVSIEQACGRLRRVDKKFS